VQELSKHLALALCLLLTCVGMARAQCKDGCDQDPPYPDFSTGHASQQGVDLNRITINRPTVDVVEAGGKRWLDLTFYQIRPLCNVSVAVWAQVIYPPTSSREEVKLFTVRGDKNRPDPIPQQPGTIRSEMPLKSVLKPGTLLRLSLSGGCAPKGGLPNHGKPDPMFGPVPIFELNW
jgi:hypothetical protein